MSKTHTDSLRSELLRVFELIPETKPLHLKDSVYGWLLSDGARPHHAVDSVAEALARDAMVFRKLLKDKGNSVQLTREFNGRLTVRVQDATTKLMSVGEDKDDTRACIAACRAVHQQENTDE